MVTQWTLQPAVTSPAPALRKKKRRQGGREEGGRGEEEEKKEEVEEEEGATDIHSLNNSQN